MIAPRQATLEFDEGKIIVPDAVLALVRSGAPVAVGISGGKDSVACAIATAEFLAEQKHAGPKILVHSDLGLVEWQDSGPSCERTAAYLAARYGPEEWPLHITRRRAGGMMERWESRWESSVRRYLSLSCVKLILPWSTPSMRFCTSELKSAPIAAYLKRQFGKRPILSVTGIRADESVNRAKMPASKPNPRLPAGSLDWNPLLRWPVDRVFETIRAAGVRLHEAYTVFGSSRVSCAFCIMSALDDLRAALKDGRNFGIYQRMTELELGSAFAFQGGKWLADLRPEQWVERIAAAKAIMERREKIERAIPAHLLFTKGWPEIMPTPAEADLLAAIRAQVCRLYGWEESFSTGEAVTQRYAQLMREKATRDE